MSLTGDLLCFDGDGGGNQGLGSLVDSGNEGNGLVDGTRGRRRAITASVRRHGEDSVVGLDRRVSRSASRGRVSRVAGLRGVRLRARRRMERAVRVRGGERRMRYLIGNRRLMVRAL